MSDHENIRDLNLNKPYEASTLSKLESHVETQFNSGNYDFEANKALLKIYQCYPDLLKVNILEKVLVLSMMKFPKNDFLMLSFLINSKSIVNNDKIKCIENSFSLLENGKFIEFWAEYSYPLGKEIFTASKFKEAIQNFIINNLQIAFKTISTKLFLGMMGLSNDELNSYCASSKHIEGTNNDIISFSSNYENQIRSKHFEEILRFDEAQRLVSSIKKASLN